jgi:ribosomal protein S18 acetylase RimI-like enzyme
VKQAFIRQAKESDVRCIAELQRRWLGEDNVYGLMPEWHEQIRAALGPYLLVAEAADEVVGFVSGSVRTSGGMAVIPAGESYLEVENLYVLPEFRGRGTGGGLITRLLEEARGRGVAYALLYSAAKDIHAALRFYERQHFRSWYVQMFREL